MNLTKKISYAVLAGLIYASMPTNSYAGFGAGLGVGLLGGLNAYAGYRFNDGFFLSRMRVRGDFNYLDLDDDFKIDDIKYDLNWESKIMGLAIDFYPFNNTPFLGWFRLTAGYYKLDAELSGSAIKTISEPVEIGDTTYTVDASGDVTISPQLTWDGSYPYLGIGADITLFLGMKLTIDAGVIFSDEPDIKLDVAGMLCLPPTYTSCVDASDPAVQADIDEEIEKIKDDATGVDYYPMIKVGLAIQF